MRTFQTTFLALLAVISPAAVSAAMVASYADGSLAGASALVNQASATSGLVVSNLTAQGFAPADITRNTFTNLLPGGRGEWLFSRAADTKQLLGSADDYFSFTVQNTGPQAAFLGDFSFSAVSANNNTNIGAAGFYYTLFVDSSGSGTFTQVGPSNGAVSPERLSTSDPVFSPIGDFQQSLAGMAILPGQTYEFRLGVHDNSSATAAPYGSAKAGFAQDLTLTAFVPEPAAASLFLLGCLALGIRRNR